MTKEERLRKKATKYLNTIVRSVIKNKCGRAFKFEIIPFYDNQKIKEYIKEINSLSYINPLNIEDIRRNIDEENNRRGNNERVFHVWGNNSIILEDWHTEFQENKRKEDLRQQVIRKNIINNSNTFCGIRLFPNEKEGFINCLCCCQEITGKINLLDKINKYIVSVGSVIIITNAICKLIKHLM